MTEYAFQALRPYEPDSPDADVVAQQFPYDGPHSPERTTAALEAVDALVRYVNNATQTREGIGLAPQVYDHLCELSGAAEGFPQLVAQLRQWALDTTEDRTVRHDEHRADADRGMAAGQDTAAAVARHLAEASGHVQAVAASISEARSALSHLCHDLPAEGEA